MEPVGSVSDSSLFLASLSLSLPLGRPLPGVYPDTLPQLAGGLQQNGRLREGPRRASARGVPPGGRAADASLQGLDRRSWTRQALDADEKEGSWKTGTYQETIPIAASRSRSTNRDENCTRSEPSMSAGHVGGGARKTMTSRINDMLRRPNRVVPLGFSTRRSSRSKGLQGPSISGDDPAGQVAGSKHQRRVLILMSDTGGGHRASAEAIKATFELEYGDEYKVTVIDLWKEHTPWPFNQMPKSYSFLVKHETLWKVAFYATKPRFVHQPQMAATSAFVAREVAKGLHLHKPDVIVSVHPLMQHIPLRVLRSRGLLKQIPFTTVITDLTTCHPTWFHKLATICFCPTKDVAQRALKAGLKQHQIRVHGLPIRPTFGHPTAPKEELRRELGMDVELPAVLLMGGGEGMGPVEATARALAKNLAGGGTPKGQLIVICGRNKKLQSKLEAIDWPMPTLIKGFVTNMSEWMAAGDCVITKAGPGTIAEAMIRGLPMILNDYIAGQEVGNVPYVVNNGLGRFCENPPEIASIVAEWFGPKRDELQRMMRNALRLARPDAVFKIVHDLDQLARRKDALTQRQLALT